MPRLIAIVVGLAGALIIVRPGSGVFTWVALLPVCMALVALTFVAIALLRWPLAWVLLGIGGAGCVWAWIKLGADGGPRAKVSP